MSDVTVIDPKAPVAPVAAPAVADPATPPVAAEPVAADPVAKPVNPNSPKWALDRISQESQGRREAESLAQREAARADAAEELLRRMQTTSATSPTGTAPRTEPAPRPVTAAPTGDRRAEVAAEAARQRFLEDINAVSTKGIAQFGADSFVGTVKTLEAVGATDDFLADVLAIDKDNAHALFQKIAAEPERAATLARLPSRQRIAEITRMTLGDKPNGSTVVTEPKTEPKPSATVSKAPPPAPPINTGSTQVTEKHWWDDGIDDAEVDKLFFDPKRIEARGARAR